MFIFTAMIDGDQVRQEINYLELPVRQGEIINLRGAGIEEKINTIRATIPQITGDNRGYIPRFVVGVLNRIPDKASAIYSPIFLHPKLTIQLISYSRQDERYFMTGVNGFNFHLKRSQLEDAGSLRGIDEFENFRVLFRAGNPFGAQESGLTGEKLEEILLGKIEKDLMDGIRNMDNYLRAKRMDEYSLIKIGTGKLIALKKILFNVAGITASSQSQV